jgi:hypothetical protein
MLNRSCRAGSVRILTFVACCAALAGLSACTSDLGTGPGLEAVMRCEIGVDSIPLDSARGWWARVDYCEKP